MRHRSASRNPSTHAGWQALGAGLLLLVALTAAPVALHGQQLRGSVRDSARHEPVAGAVVLLLDARGRTVAQSTTDQRGAYTILATPEVQRLRVLRLGFRPIDRVFSLADAANAIDVALVPIPVLLGEVRVTAPASCPARKDRAAALALLEQVRAGLLSTVVARSQNSARMTRAFFERQLEGGGDRIMSQVVRRSTAASTTESFGATRDAMEFVRDGFRDDSAGGYTFFGPDAKTLIDDAFSSGYCFHVMEPARDRLHQIGLGFEAATHREGRIDITGALWVDTVARVLRDLEFRYVGLGRSETALDPGGRLAFREMSNGVVLIDRWALRLISGRDYSGGVGISSTGVVTGRRSARLTVHEIGGELLHASWPNGDTWSAPLGKLRIQAVTSRGRPASGATVRLTGTDYEATADSAGLLEITDLLPGPYAASIVDPKLATVDVRIVTPLRFTAERDSTISARLEIETAEEFVAKRCGRDQPITGQAWLLGRIVTADGKPAPDARWSIRDQYGSVQVEGGRVGGDGLFHWCQLPYDSQIEIQVWLDYRKTTQKRTLDGRLTLLTFELPPQ